MKTTRKERIIFLVLVGYLILGFVTGILVENRSMGMWFLMLVLWLSGYGFLVELIQTFFPELQKGSFNPSDMLICEEFNGRLRGPSIDKIRNLAESMYDTGQQTPIQIASVDLLPPRKYVVVIGIQRVRAARMIREGFVGTDGQERHDPEFLLQAVPFKAVQKKFITS